MMCQDDLILTILFPLSLNHRDVWEFLTLICGTETYKRSRFIKDISLICARLYGSVLMKSWGPIPVQLQNGVV
jgi:hypothetical protein